MAKPDHKTSARFPSKPASALGRPYWVLGLSRDDVVDVPPKSVLKRLPATCATLNKAICALTQILGNSEAFRAMQDACDTVDPGQLPLDVDLTDGLLAALYVLTEQAELVSMEMLEATLSHLGKGDNPPRQE